jgi:hypothetical protein
MNVIGANISSEALTFNETTVRYRIIDPIIKALGYFEGDDVYVNLEEKLSYPYIHIGRKSKKDVPVGYPDYRAGLKGARGSFIVEAKAGNVPITKAEVEQAHSYAAHAQVGANYFVLCNGLEFNVYETLSGPDYAPILSVPLDKLNSRFHEIENILSPRRLELNCRIEYDTGLKLCDGVGSSIKVRSGIYTMRDYAYRFFLNDQDQTAIFKAIPGFDDIEGQLELFKSSFQLRVDQGVMQRDENGRIFACASFAGVTTQNHEGLKLVGLDKMTFATDSEFISTSPENPTIFESTKDFAVEKGTVFPQLFGGAVEVQSAVVGDLFVNIAIHLDGKILKGQYVSIADYHSALPMLGDLKIELDIAGDFEMEID